MANKQKEIDANLFYMNQDGQVQRETIDVLMQKKKAKEREKRIQASKKQEEKSIDFDTETVINMTNKNSAEKDKINKQKIYKEQKKKKKRIKKIKLILKLILIAFIIVGSIIFTMTSPIFNIKDIVVNNNNHITSENIVSLSGLVLGQNIFRFWNSNVENAIKENPYIEKVRVSRKIPSTIEITVEERNPKYCFQILGKYAYINTQGYILEISEDIKQLVILKGLSTKEEDTIPGNRLNEDDLKKLDDVIKIMSVAKDNDLESKVTSIDITNQNKYSIYIEEEQKTIHIGDSSNLSNKMIYVLAIIEREKGIAGDIYADGDLNNKFRTYFREKV